MSAAQLLPFYIAGLCASFYIGWRVALWQMAKHYEYDLTRAYERGWRAGQGFLGRINERKLDLESSVRILNGEDWNDDAF